MSFYLLKSTVERQVMGDILLDANKVEQIALLEKEEDGKTVYILKVYLDSEDTCYGQFTTTGEAKKVIKEILKDKINDQDLNDLLPVTEDEDDKKRKKALTELKQLM